MASSSARSQVSLITMICFIRSRSLYDYLTIN